MPCARKQVAAAVGAVAAAVGALESITNASVVDAPTVTKEGTNRQSNTSATEGGVVTASNPTPKRKPKVWFMGHKIAVSEGQEEPTKAALKKARNAETYWTDDAWKAVMKTAQNHFEAVFRMADTTALKKKLQRRTLLEKHRA